MQAQRADHCFAAVVPFSKMHPFGRPFVSHRLCIFYVVTCPHMSLKPQPGNQVTVGVVCECS